MIDFYFDEAIKLEDLVSDGEIVFLTDNGWEWYGLKEDPENTALAISTNDDGYITFACGHDAALPVVFYLYEKRGIKFHDNNEFFYELDGICDRYGIELTNDEWNTIYDYICLNHMTYYVKPGYPLHNKLEKEKEEYEPKYNEIMSRTGIDRIRKEEEEKCRELFKERMETKPKPIISEDGDLPF